MSQPENPVNTAVGAAIADLEQRPGTGEAPVEVVKVETRILLRRGDRVWSYVTGADGIPRLHSSGEKDGGREKVRPPRMDL